MTSQERQVHCSDELSLRIQRQVGAVERAVMTSKLDRQIMTARLHAITGNDPKNINEASGAIFYVVMYAAATVGFNIDCPDWRIVRGALNTIYELSAEDDVDGLIRTPILSGLDAIERIKNEMPTSALARGVIDMSMRVRHGNGILGGNFMNLAKGLSPDGNRFVTKNRVLSVCAVKEVVGA